VAAVLHDTLEDTDAKREQIEAEFGRRVASLVEDLTRKEPSEEEIDGLSTDEIWSLRSNMLLDEIGEMGLEAQAIKLADRLSNVREALRTKKGKKLDRYLDQSKRILKIVPKSVNPGLWKEICELLEK
jgi:(p)ppGpp synthase/HD superfamily hydrolase